MWRQKLLKDHKTLEKAKISPPQEYMRTECPPPGESLVGSCMLVNEFDEEDQATTQTAEITEHYVAEGEEHGEDDQDVYTLTYEDGEDEELTYEDVLEMWEVSEELKANKEPETITLNLYRKTASFKGDRKVVLQLTDKRFHSLRSEKNISLIVEEN